MPQKRFLFLQGPVSPFFTEVGDSLRALGHAVHRINLNLGDSYFWPGAGAVPFHGRPAEWPDFISRFLDTHRITHVVLRGEQRPYHKAAIAAAAARGVEVVVTDLGYIRPDWIVLERDGMNAASRFTRDPAEIVRLGASLPPPDLVLRHQESFRLQAAWDVLYNLLSMLPWPFRHYRNHLFNHPVPYYAGMAIRLLMRPLENRRAAAVFQRLAAPQVAAAAAAQAAALERAAARGAEARIAAAQGAEPREIGAWVAGAQGAGTLGNGAAGTGAGETGSQAAGAQGSGAGGMAAQGTMLPGAAIASPSGDPTAPEAGLEDAALPAPGIANPPASSTSGLFLMAMQMENDFSIRAYSRYPDMDTAVKEVAASFAGHAPAGTHLLIKVHPLDPGLKNWGRRVRRIARDNGLEGRMHYLGGGNLGPIIQQMRGLVTVNSTVGLLAVMNKVPTFTLGEALYRLPGLVFGGTLDAFWTEGEPADPAMREGFLRSVAHSLHVRGLYHAKPGRDVAVQGTVRRLHEGILNRPVPDALDPENEGSTAGFWPARASWKDLPR